MPQKTITDQDLYRLQQVVDVRLSPDGKFIIYTQRRVDAKTEKKYTNLWLVPTAGGKPRQFTRGNQADSSPRWSPDGREIAFLSNRADKDKPAQVYIIPIEGGEAYQLTEIEGSIFSINWSPDGKFILCEVIKTDQEVLEREKDERKKKLGVVSRHVNRMFYKLDGFGYLAKERKHLWIINTKTGKAKQITDHPIFDESQPAWSPDSRMIVFVSNRSEDPDRNPDLEDLYLIPAGGGEMQKITTPVGSKSLPSFSPDGKWIAYLGKEGISVGYKNTSLWIVPADSSQPAKNLTEAYDIHVGAWTINDMGTTEMMPPTWSLDGKRLYFQVDRHGSTVVYEIGVDGKGLQPLIGEGGAVGSFCFDRRQETMAYFYARMDNPGDVYVMDMKSRQPRRLTEVNRAVLKDVNLGEIEEVWYPSPGGMNLQGWILKPPDFDPNKKYPSILEIHGGPQLQYGNFFMHEFYYLAAKGYVVYFTNPRGGRGYGEAHTKAIWNDWGSADYDDLMAWVDLVEQKPYIDKDRMGVTGGSYGGYMTVWIIGHTHRFKAAVAQRVVSNWLSMWGSSDFNWNFQDEIADNKPPFEHFEKYWQKSPMSTIGNARTPTLVIHNENDLRCPIEQGEQVFIALKYLGVETEMVRFPEEFHGLSRTGRTDRRIARLNYISGWFDKHL